MAKATYELIGFGGFLKDLDAISPSMQAKCEPVVERTAHRVQAHAQSLAPRREGDLAASIEAQGRGLSWFVGLVDRDIPARGGRGSAHRNPSVYGIWYELGFLHRRIKKRPFMAPAIETAARTYEQEIAAAIGEALR